MVLKVEPPTGRRMVVPSLRLMGHVPFSAISKIVLFAILRVIVISQRIIFRRSVVSPIGPISLPVWELVVALEHVNANDTSGTMTKCTEYRNPIEIPNWIPVVILNARRWSTARFPVAMQLYRLSVMRI